MRKFTIIITLWALLTNMMLAHPESTININITHTIHNPASKPHRDADIIPMICSYETLEYDIYINFIEQIGNTFITVMNYSTGEVIYDSADSSNGQAIIQTSGTPGNYLLKIETASGDCYEGEFTVE